MAKDKKKVTKKDKNKVEKVETADKELEVVEGEKVSKPDKKKKNKKVKNSSISNSAFDSEITHIVTLVGIILLIFCVFYWITVLITNKDKAQDNKEEAPTEASISYDRIVLGRSFSMSDSSYYVLYYDMKDDDISSTYSSLVSTYRGKSDTQPLYVVNMGDALNSQAVADSSNKSATNASELKINGPTLIKFTEGKIETYIEGEEAITSALK